MGGDGEHAFNAAARRNRLLAQWAARLMGLRPADTESYVTHRVAGDVGHARGHAIIDQVVRDLRDAGVPTPREQVAAMFVQLEARVHAEMTDQEARG